MNIFNQGKFQLHSSGWSSFKIDCDALSDEDLAALALQFATRFHWRSVHPIPTGGNRFAAALDRYSIPAIELPRLIVDDVFTTGASMEEEKKQLDDAISPIGVVIFARGVTPGWVKPMFLWTLK